MRTKGALFVALLLGILVGSPTALATELPPAFTQALVALETNNCPAALQSFVDIPHPPPEGMKERVSFLTGYCLLKTERPGEALPLLEQAATEDGLLADYALYYAAEAALAIEERNKATMLLSQLVSRYPKSRLAEKAQWRLGTTYVDMEQHEEAQGALTAFLERYGASSNAPAASLLLAKLYLTMKRPAEAVPLLKRLYIYSPTDPAAAEAERALREIPDLPPLSPAEQLLRTEILLNEGKYAVAVPILTSLLTSDPDNRDVRLLLGRSLFGVKEYPQAITVLLPLTDPGVQPALQMKALFLMGRASLRSGEYPQAIAYLERIANAFPQSGLADDALYLIGLNQEERGNVADALNVYDRLLRLYPDGGLGDTARWQRAWLLFRQRKLARAERELKQLLNDYPYSPQKTQALFWRGRFLEEMGKHSEAEGIYRQLLSEATLDPYYEWRARQRLKLDPKPISPQPPPPFDHRLSAPLAKARELLFLRMWEDAAAEYWELAPVHPDQIALQWEACQALARANEFEKVLGLARRSVFTMIRNGRREEALPTFWSFLYPLGFWPWVDQYVKETPLDPYLVTAVIREESAFSPTALSSAGARGLMQLMPATAARMARETNLPKPPDLDAPGPNIALGTRYLAKLQELFGGDVVLALAAYNAGPHSVQRWVKDHHPSQDLEAFIEEIPYPETRGYVKRVLGTYDRYRTLYARPG